MYVGPSYADQQATICESKQHAVHETLISRVGVQSKLTGCIYHKNNSCYQPSIDSLLQFLKSHPQSTLETVWQYTHNSSDEFSRGAFKPLQAERIDLPDKKPAQFEYPVPKWIDYLPPEIAKIFADAEGTFFYSVLSEQLRDPTNHERILCLTQKPKVYGSQTQYLRLLQKADNAGMIMWTRPGQKTLKDVQLGDKLVMTLFAVSKSAVEDRLISWPVLQNEYLPDPPHTSLPDPSLFNSIKCKSKNLSGIYLDVENMFHNILLPNWLALLFPMQPVHLFQLDLVTQQNVRKQLGIPLEAKDVILQPCQATLPMGFKWSVYIAHTITQNCIHKAFSIFKQSSLCHSSDIILATFKREEAPFSVLPLSPLLLHIIDDVAIVVNGWKEASLLSLYRIIRNMLKSISLPCKESKSCDYEKVEHSVINFIGFDWHLQSSIIIPSKTKTSTVLHQTKAIRHASLTTEKDWLKTMGRLVWIAMSNRPLLSVLYQTFQLTHKDIHQPFLHLDFEIKQEIQNLETLIPLATIEINLPVSNLLVAFDASLIGGAVVYTYVTSDDAELIWKEYQNSQHLLYSDTLHNHDATVVNTVATSATWTTAFSHKWKDIDTINVLECTAAVMAISWLASRKLRNHRVILLTDSMVALGALTKGRSSAHKIMVQCRRFGTIALSFNLRPTMCHIPSTLNPADRPSRAF